MPDYIVDKIFPSYEVHLTGGASGSGKTTFEGQFIEDWRQGKDIFGYKSYPAPFCYIACDRSLQSIEATLTRIGVPYKEWPLISLIDYGAITGPAHLIQAARKRIPEVKVIWLDGIHSLCPKGKINDYGVVQEFLVSLTRMCQRERVTIKGLGHATKVREGEGFLNPRHRFLGSVAWGGYSDTMTIIDQEKPDDPSDSSRDVYLLSRNEENMRLKYEFVEGRLELKTDAGEFVLNHWLGTLTAGHTLSTANLLTQGDKVKVSRAGVYRWIKLRVTDGKLLKTGHGIYTVSFPQ